MPPPEAGAASGTRLLLVEDSLTQAERLKYTLEQHGFHVSIARTGDEALAAVAAERPALVISDVVMPGMDGYELCRRVRRDPATADVPIVLLTALSEPADIMNGLAAGASDFVAKAATADTLVARIARTLEQRRVCQESPDGDGLEIWFSGQRYGLESDPSQVIGFLLSSFEDAVEKNLQLNAANTQLKQAVNKIAVLEKRYQKLMEFTPAALFVVGRDGIIWFANQAAETLFERHAEELKGTPFPVPLTPGESTEVELRPTAGKTAIVELQVVETTWGDSEARLVSLWDVTENVRLRKQLQELSVTDELTGLANRRGFLILAEQQRKLAVRGHSMVLLYMDLDDFKVINDTKGHAAGDRALVEAARILQGCVRDSDILARMGGDEFAALLIDAAPGFVEGARDRVRNAFEQRNQRLAKQTGYQIGCSVGSAIYRGEEPVELDELIAVADAQMYDDKQATKAAQASGASGA